MSKTTDNQKEIFIVVDKNDRIIGYWTRKECHQSRKLIHRASALVIFNKKGEILLQKRSLTKDLYPGFYTLSCTGHLMRGENYQQAIEREVKEELGICRRLKLKFFKKIIFSSDEETEIVAIFLAKNDGPFKADPVEMESIEFFSKRLIKQLINKKKSPLEPFARKVIKELKII